MMLCRQLVEGLQEKREVLSTKRCDDLMHEQHSKNTCPKQLAEDEAMKLADGEEDEEVDVNLPEC